MREFETGATRDDDNGKLDYEGFINPLALRAYANYMHSNRHQKDGKLRDSDNWQKGMPNFVYVKSLLRHVIDVWLWHRGYSIPYKIEEAIGAVIFNAFGLLTNLVINREGIILETSNPEAGKNQISDPKAGMIQPWIIEKWDI